MAIDVDTWRVDTIADGGRDSGGMRRRDDELLLQLGLAYLSALILNHAMDQGPFEPKVVFEPQAVLSHGLLNLDLAHLWAKDHLSLRLPLSLRLFLSLEMF